MNEPDINKENTTEQALTPHTSLDAPTQTEQATPPLAHSTIPLEAEKHSKKIELLPPDTPPTEELADLTDPLQQDKAEKDELSSSRHSKPSADTSQPALQSSPVEQTAKLNAASPFFQPKKGTDDSIATASPQEENTTPEQVVAPKAPGFFASHPVHRIQHAMPPSFSSRTFTLLGYMPWITLTMLLVAQTIFTLDARALWYSDEIRHANAFVSMLENGKWFILEMNGHAYPDKPPVYFWLLRGIYMLLHETGPVLYFTAAAVSGLLYLWATLALGRLVGRFDGKTLLASGLILLSTGYFIGTLHYARMDLLFSTFIILSHIAFFVAWSKPRSLLFMLAAFFCAALACLTKGPLGILFPLLSSIIFLVWRATLGRLFRLDVLAGLVLFLVIIGCWVVGVFVEHGNADFLINEVFQKNIVARGVNTFHHKQPWHYYLLRLPLMMLPWLFLLICMPWHRIFAKNTIQGVKESRQPIKEGIAFLWIMALTPIPFLSLLSGKILIYYLPFLAPLALLAGRAMLHMSSRQAATFRALLVSFFLVAGVILVVATLILFRFITPPEIKGIPGWTLEMNPWFFLVAALILLTGFALWFILRKSNPEGVLLIVGIASALIGVTLTKMAAPSLDTVLSPKAQATVMKEYIAKGYKPYSYKVYDGTYAYYANATVPGIDSLALLHDLSPDSKVVLGIRRSSWEQWENRPACFREVHRQWIETREYILAVCSSQPGTIIDAPLESVIDSPQPAEPAKPSLEQQNTTTPLVEFEPSITAPSGDVLSPYAPEGPQSAKSLEQQFNAGAPDAAEVAPIIDSTTNATTPAPEAPALSNSTTPTTSAIPTGDIAKEPPTVEAEPLLREIPAVLEHQQSEGHPISPAN